MLKLGRARSGYAAGSEIFPLPNMNPKKKMAITGNGNKRAGC
jgi:hypothetical protein